MRRWGWLAVPLLSLALSLAMAAGVGAVEYGPNLTAAPLLGTDCLKVPEAGGTLTSGCGGTLTTLDSLTVTNSATVGGVLTASGGIMSAGQVTVAQSSLTLTGNGNDTGVILLPTEYVGADRPNLRFVDANNGVSGTSSSVSLWAYGGRRLHANATGVGIGTASPATTLDVNGSAQFGSGVAKSTVTAAGLIVPRAATLAQIQAFTPTANELGGFFTCSDCAGAYTVCQATGTTVQGFRLGFSGTSECK